MACEVCEHCDAPVKPGDATKYDGFSYHRHCRKCYVCSETDLQNAEIFRGVLFCAGCSQRIFQGCSTARRTGKKRRSLPRRHPRLDKRVLELTTVLTTSESSKNLSDLSRESAGTRTKIIDNNLKKCSKEFGVTTDVNSEVLRSIRDTTKKCSHSPRRTCRRRKRRKAEGRTECSDIRMAELGASTEIAHVALRNRYEKPVVIQSDSRLKKFESRTKSFINGESDKSGDFGNWTDSDNSTSKDYGGMQWINRHFKSILKIPFKSFKNGILHRSSLIDVLTNDNTRKCFMKKITMLFQEEITEHQKRGLKRLYSTIKRRRKPYKFGWLHLMTKVSRSLIRQRDPAQRRKCFRSCKRCKHFKRSHSYRCMRAQAMKLAGPTRSELADMREKMKNFLSPNLLKNLSIYNRHCAAIMMSQACGSTKANSTHGSLQM